MQDEPESPGSDSGLMDNLGFAEGRGGDPSAVDPRPWRLAALVGLICAVVLLLAIALINIGGGDGTPKDVGLPSVTTTPTEALPTPTGARATTTTSVAPTVRRTVHPRRTTHPPTTSAAPSTTATPTPHPRTSTVVATPVAPVRTVTVSQGPRDFRCGGTCHFVVVRLTNFAGGHLVQCLSAGGTLYGGAPFGGVEHQYVTAQQVSFSCSFSGPGSVWVTVDGHYESNHVSW